MIAIAAATHHRAGACTPRTRARSTAATSKKRVSGPLEPIRNGLRHLVCYSIRPIARIDPPDEVQARNQFGLERLKLRRERELGVPSLKTVVDPPPPPTSIEP